MLTPVSLKTELVQASLRDDHPVGQKGFPVGDDLDPGAVGAHGPDGGLLQDPGTVPAREGHVRGVGAARVHDPRILLVDGPLGPPQAELGPTPHQLAGVEQLVVEAVLFEGRDVPFYVAGPGLARVALVDGLDDEPARLEQELQARLALDLVPGLVGVRGEGGVLGLVLGEPDDAGVVFRRAAAVPEAKLFDPEH